MNQLYTSMNTKIKEIKITIKSSDKFDVIEFKKNLNKTTPNAEVEIEGLC